MFTGIIKNRAVVTVRKSQGGQVRFCFSFLQSEKRKLELGESITVDGVCLTVAKIVSKGFEADAVRETLQATTLSSLKTGGEVNIERALRYGDLLGGHFVTGHVDSRGEILKIETKGKNRLYSFKTPKALAPFIAPKGSVVIDGISLTVQAVKGKIFTVTIVPHTWAQTGLKRKKQGDEVNLEADLIARYLKQANDFSRTLPKGSKYKVTVGSLQNMGF